MKSSRRARALTRFACLSLAFAAAGCGVNPSADTTENLSFQIQLTSEANIRISQTTSLGAQLVFVETIYRATGNTAIGRDQASCTRVAPGNGVAYECLITFVLPTGDIYGEAASSHDGPSSGVVTGGTGSYSGVRGTFLFGASADPLVKLEFSLTK
jgi:hypothetical protein